MADLTQYDWTQFSKSIVIHAGIQDLYQRFCTREGMESWFLRKCEFTREGEMLNDKSMVQAGDRYHFLWHGWSDDVFETGIWLSCNQVDQLAFTFNGNGVTEIEVHIKLEPMDGSTLLTLSQICIPDDENARSHWHLGCLEGWVFYLTNLKSIAEGGLDLRNKNPSIQGVFNA